MTNFVAEAKDLALFDNCMRIGCFRRTGLLMDYTKSDSDKDIKPQGVISTIVMPDSYETETSNTDVEFENPTETFSPETENEDLDATDIHPDGVGENRHLEQELVVEEEYAEQLLSTETLDYLNDVDSDDDVGFYFFVPC